MRSFSVHCVLCANPTPVAGEEEGAIEMEMHLMPPPPPEKKGMSFAHSISRASLSLFLSDSEILILGRWSSRCHSPSRPRPLYLSGERGWKEFLFLPHTPLAGESLFPLLLSMRKEEEGESI